MGRGAAGPMTSEGLERMVATIYSDRNAKVSVDSMKREEISALSDEMQLLLVSDRRIHSVKDRYGVGPVHDLARFGRPAVQLRIFDGREVFDAAAFRGLWGTPMDFLALYGCLRVQRKILKLPRAELAAVRSNGRTLLHGLARSINREDHLRLLNLPPSLLRTKTEGGDSVIGVMYYSGNPVVKRQVYERYPTWNRM